MISHPALDGIRHGFCTRQGGTGNGLYESLNCGFGSGDDAAVVAVNWGRALALLGAAEWPLVTVHQIHSAKVAVVDQPWAQRDNPKADALVTRQRGLCLGILTADCVPLLFADPDAGVIGAAHAGWQGALAGVAEVTVAAMEALGAQAARIRAVIGPAIQQISYEVGAEFFTRFAEADPSSVAYFIPSSRAGRYRFDLPGFIEARLTALSLAAIGRTGLDTCDNPERFFSYRRATLRGEPDYGRQISLIALDPVAV